MHEKVDYEEDVAVRRQRAFVRGVNLPSLAPDFNCERESGISYEQQHATNMQLSTGQR